MKFLIDVDNIPNTMYNYLTALWTRPNDKFNVSLWRVFCEMGQVHPNMMPSYNHYMKYDGSFDLNGIISSHGSLTNFIENLFKVPTRVFSDRVKEGFIETYERTYKYQDNTFVRIIL